MGAISYLFLQRVGSNAIVECLKISTGEIFAWIVTVSYPHQSPRSGRKIIRQWWQNYFQLLFWNFRFIAQRAAQPDRLLLHVIFHQIELFVRHEIELQHSQGLELGLLGNWIGQREGDVTGELKSTVSRQTNDRRLFRCARFIGTLFLKKTILACVNAGE